jgi:hypothetical protein
VTNSVGNCYTIVQFYANFICLPFKWHVVRMLSFCWEIKEYCFDKRSHNFLDLGKWTFLFWKLVRQGFEMQILTGLETRMKIGITVCWLIKFALSFLCMSLISTKNFQQAITQSFLAPLIDNNCKPIRQFFVAI